MPLRPFAVEFLLVWFLLAGKMHAQQPRLSTPAGTRPTSHNQIPAIIPNGRLLTPAGQSLIVPPHPFGLTLSPNGKIVAALSCGREPIAVTLVSDIDRPSPYIRQVPPGAETDEEIMPTAFMGLAFAPDSRTLYVSGGGKGEIYIFDAIAGKKAGTIALNAEIAGKKFADSFIGDLVLTRDGTRLYALDQANFRIVIIEPTPATKETPAGGKLLASIETGRYPFALRLSPDEKAAYVVNVGMFEYSMIKGISILNHKGWLPFPPFGFNTPEMREGIRIGDVEVPGLGDPNVPESFSVWKVDLSTAGQEKVVAKVKTGVKVGEKVEGVPAVGGSNPNALACDGQFLYVSNGSNDSVSVIDAATFEVVETIPLRISEVLGALKGQIPFGLALSPDGKRLYVCEAGINSIAVINTTARRVLGHIPTAWFPSKVEVSRDGSKLYISCAKGYGAGPNGGRNYVPDSLSHNIGNLMKGVVQIVPVPRDEELAPMTDRVLHNFFAIEEAVAIPEEKKRNPVPPYAGAYASPIRHLVYITKENRTFDQVFGEYEKAVGDPTLTDFGLKAKATASQSPPVEEVNVMPNHQALSRRYAIGDNFYCDSDYSADGHRWMVGTFPNAWTETATKTTGRGERITSTAPGRRLMTGSSGAIYPEDYNEAGSIWEHLHRNGLEFFNYGLGFEMAGSVEEDFPDTGIRIAVNYPLPEPLFLRTSRNFPTYNMAVPDQVRVNHFEQEFRDKWLSGKEPFPRVITMMLPNDHGAREAPARGYPYLHSYMADNDLALGRVIELLSKSPWWKEMAVFVVEDDAQGGRDHIDHHRSILMVLGPWVKRGHVTKVHASFGSVLKTIFLILGLPPLNQFDATASDLSDCFASEPDAAPYHALPPDPRIFDPQKALDTYDEKFAWEYSKENEEMDDPEFTKEQRQELRDQEEQRK